ncbi:MAG: hypothetical protein IT204_00310 [Fimbriimonadaceae bacterium]|nr:hypothetical protein [Fimbriimonadaceae bacterium]
MRIARLVGLVCWPGLLLAAPVAELGPRVNLVGAAVPLVEALDSIGRQINRRFYGAVLRSPATARRPCAFELRDADLGTALRAVETVSGYRLRRSSRWLYTLDGSPPTAAVGQPWGAWNLWLTTVRSTSYALVYPGWEGRLYQQQYLTPALLLEAPSDQEALRLRGIAAPEGVTAAGLVLPAIDPRSRVIQPEPSDPRFWQVATSLTAPPPAERHLAALRCEVTWAARLTERTFEFQLPATERQVQTIDIVDATLEPRAGTPREPYTVALAGQHEAAHSNAEATAFLRGLLVEGQLHDAAGLPLYTETRQVDGEASGLIWRGQYTFHLTELDAGATPARLVLRVTLADGEGPPERLQFDHVLLPRAPVRAAG